MIKISFDKREGAHNNETVSENIQLEVAVRQVLKLDGKVHTLVMFDRNDGWQLMVGGGPDHYIVTLGGEDENLTLHNENGDGTKEVEICAGGQYGDFSEIICVDIEQSKLAVKAFFESTERDLDWI